MRGVVFDVNVYVEALLSGDNKFLELAKVPPKSHSSSLDCLSLAFDAEKFSLFVSPHILGNVGRVLALAGLSERSVARSLEALIEIVHCSGGSVVEPPRLAFDSADFEDNLVLDLMKATNCLVLLTSDRELRAMNPWNHRLILTPAEFLENIL